MPKPIAPDLAELLPSWELSLRAERKSPATIKGYGDAVRRFLAWCERTNTAPELSKAAVNGFIADMLDEGAQAATAVARQLGVRRFADWLTAEGELPVDPLLGLKTPKLDTKVIEPLTSEQLRALLKACSGKDFRDRRDEAILRFMFETGARAGEVVALGKDDVDPTAGSAIVRRGKGGRGRIVPFGPFTSAALDRYIRIRRGHQHAAIDALWLGDRGRGALAYPGLAKTLAQRADVAGIKDFHLHRLRHTAADRWLAAGGSEGGLLAVAGWSSSAMLQRYTKARASDRAAAEARTLNLGDL